MANLPYVGFLPPELCWGTGMGFSFDTCCVGQDAIDRCFRHWQDGYEPCCLFLNTQRKLGHVAVSGAHIAAGEPVMKGGGDVDLDGLMYTVALNSKNIGPVSTVNVRGLLEQENCYEARMAGILLHDTRVASFRLMEFVGSHLARSARSMIAGTSMDLYDSLHELQSVLANVWSVKSSHLEDLESVSSQGGCGWYVGDFGALELFRRHRNNVDTDIASLLKRVMLLLSEGAQAAHGLHMLHNPALRTVGKLAERSQQLMVYLDYVVALSQMGPTSYTKLRLEDRFCCYFKDVVEGIVVDVFRSRGNKPRDVRLAEVGVGRGGSALHLLSRYAWVQYVGVDSLDMLGQHNKVAGEAIIRASFRSYGQRSRLFVPMNTTEALKILWHEGQRFDVLVFDARNDRTGFLVDAIGWIRLLNPGGYVVCHAGFHLFLRLSQHRWRRKLEGVALTTSVDGGSGYSRLL